MVNGSTDNNGDAVAPWNELGIEVVLLVTQATGPDYAKNFRDQYGLNDIYVAADDYTMMPPDAVATPVMQLVDPRTMRIVRRSEGVKWDFRDATIALARKNLTP